MVQFLRKKDSKINRMAFEPFSPNDPLLKVFLHVLPLLVSDSDKLGLQPSFQSPKANGQEELLKTMVQVTPKDEEI